MSSDSSSTSLKTSSTTSNSTNTMVTFSGSINTNSNRGNGRTYCRCYCELFVYSGPVTALATHNYSKHCSCSNANHPTVYATTVADSKDDRSLDTLLEFINGPEEENQKMSSRAAKRQRRKQCKQVNSQTNVEVESDSNRQHNLSTTTIQQENKKSKSTKKPQQLSDN